jgi:AcrR family transcriptional regulator
MVSHARERPKLTAKGERARARIVAPSARLIHQRGVAGTTLEDVKAAADVSGSQLYHYLPDKDDLVRAVVGYQADTAVSNQRQADLGGVEGLRAWRDMLVKAVRTATAGRLPPRVARRAARGKRSRSQSAHRRRIRGVVLRHQ